jgi:hypothetical protein
MAKRVLSIATVGGLAAAAVLLAMVQSGYAQATVASDREAGYVIFPKIVVDTDGFFTPGASVDTVVQLTNTSSSDPRVVHCFYVDATPRCSATTTIPCQTNTDCPFGEACGPLWVETNFTLTLTLAQPVGWSAGEGLLTNGQCSASSPIPGAACNVDADCSPGTCVPLPVGRIQPLSPLFIGELKCVEVDAVGTVVPINANDLKGEASIYTVASGQSGFVDVRSYNAIGVQAVSSDGTTQNDQVMCLGATTGSTECATAEYAQCPSTLILNHWFDDAFGPFEDPVSTDLTLVPCSEDLVTQTPTTTAIQLLVFNEFEQRFSASTRVTCYKETQLSDIDSPRSHQGSIFNVFVQGTLTGQTRIRPLTGSETDTGHGLLAVAEEFHQNRGSAAFNVNYSGTNPGHGDFVRFVSP